MKNIVSVKWLKENLANNKLILLDSSPKSTISGDVSEYEGIQIKGARYLDLKLFAEANAEFPNTIPSEDVFTSETQKLGINNDSVIVVYDNLGVYTSPRVWWLFKTFGHEQVYVLNGGLPEWIKNGFETEKTSEKKIEKGNFTPKFNSKLITYFEEVKANEIQKDFLVVDARSKGRFNKTQPEPRASLQSGCMLNAINIPYTEVLEDGKFKNEEKLKTIFSKVNTEALVFSCGSGLTACIIMLAATLVLKNNKSVYDGSWTEWAVKNELFT